MWRRKNRKRLDGDCVFAKKEKEEKKEMKKRNRLDMIVVDLD